MIIPRDELLDPMVKNALKGRHNWVIAPGGYGKSQLVQEAVDELEDRHGKEVICCDESSQFKPLMLEIGRALHEKTSPAMG